MMSDAPDFDWPQVESILGGDGQEVPSEMASIVRDLVTSTRLKLSEMRRLDPVLESRAVAARAHQLRGGLINFGFSAPGTLLLRLEMHPASAAEYPALLDEIGAVFEASRGLLADRYPTLEIA